MEVKDRGILTNDLFEAENDIGNVEYKSKLLNLDENRKQQLATQLLYRLREGNGECIYEIGILDDGKIFGLTEQELNQSIANLGVICEKVNAKINYTSVKKIPNEELMIAEIFIRNDYNCGNYIDIYVSVIGNVDAGKSSLIGVLTNGALDNGRGRTRSMITDCKHELDSGRTSTSTHHIIGFDSCGNLINDKKDIKSKNWSDIVLESNKVITLNDLCGHEKYLRTTIYGVSSVCPDYCMVIISANHGITHMTKEHIALTLSLKIPFFIVLTKLDITPDNVLETTKNNIIKLLKLPSLRKLPYFVKNENDIPIVSKNIMYENCTPIFPVSNVSGIGLKELKTFLNLLPQRKNYINDVNQPLEFMIDGSYMITGIGTVVSGILNTGEIKIGDSVLLGPTTVGGEFIKTAVRSIHIKRTSCNRARAGHYCTLALKKINRNIIRKGMVLVSENNPYRTSKEFIANINIVQCHHTSIKLNYEPYLHIGCIRQSARILSIDNVITKNNLDDDNITLRTGDKALVRFRFSYKNEYIKPNMKLIFREGKIRGIGLIQEVF